MEADAADLGLLILRLGVGIPFALHGFQKLLGWFGGGGFRGTAAWFASLGFGDGRAATVLAGVGEVAGGLGIALGILTPVSAAAVVGTMTVAALVNNSQAGFWSVAKGWELNGYLIVIATALAVAGPGALSLDRLLDIEGRLGVTLAGPIGALAVAIGALGGWLRWVTRARAA